MKVVAPRRRLSGNLRLESLSISPVNLFLQAGPVGKIVARVLRSDVRTSVENLAAMQ